jgi:negative regulator of flagellin synthesis FlgM
MKVTQNNSPIQMDAYLKQIQQQRLQQQDVQQSSTTAKGTADKVQLSRQAKEIQQSAHALGQTEDVRDEKVRQVKMDIEKGTYKVNAAKVATEMLREAFENNKVLKKIDTRA